MACHVELVADKGHVRWRQLRRSLRVRCSTRAILVQVARIIVHHCRQGRQQSFDSSDAEVALAQRLAAINLLHVQNKALGQAYAKHAR